MDHEYKDFRVGDLSAGARVQLYREWARDGWEVVGLRSRGASGKTKLVAVVRRPRSSVADPSLPREQLGIA